MQHYAIASAGRAASTTLLNLMRVSLTRLQGREPHVIWAFSPTDRMQQLQYQPDGNTLLIKGETYHYLEALKHPEEFNVITITREDHLQQVLSHVVVMKTGQYHQIGLVRKKMRVDLHDFMLVAHLVLGTQHYIENMDVSKFGRVVKTTYEEMTANFGKILQAVDLPFDPGMQAASNRLGLKFDRSAFENWDEIIEWAQSLQHLGFNLLARHLEP